MAAMMQRIGTICCAMSLLCFHRLCHDTAHDERAEGGREAHCRRHDHHAEAESQSRDEQRLLTHQRLRLLQQQRDEVNANNEPEDEEEYEFEDTHQHLCALKLLADSQRGEHHHEHDGQDILNDEHAEHQTGKTLLAKAHVVEGLENDGRRRHGQHSPQIDAVHLFPPKGMSCECTYEHHGKDDGASRNDGCCSHLQDFLERELQTESEKQEDNAYFTPEMYALHIADAGHIGHIRGGDKARHDIS